MVGRRCSGCRNRRSLGASRRWPEPPDLPIGSSSVLTVAVWAWPDAWPRTARPPTRSNARAAGSRVAAWSAATPVGSRPGRRCDTGNCSQSPQNSYSETCGPRVFPRACGGTVGVVVGHLGAAGLSPRVRGNRRCRRIGCCIGGLSRRRRSRSTSRWS